MAVNQLEKLKGIGPAIRKKLADALELNNPLTQDVSATVAEVAASKPKSKKVSKPPQLYVPAFRSGPYAMLVALLIEQRDPNSRGGLTKLEIADRGQQFCSSPMTEGMFNPLNGAIKTLLKKEFVEKSSSSCPRFSLTESGIELAQRLWESIASSHEALSIHHEAIPTDRVDLEETNVIKSGGDTVFEEILMPHGTFTVVLLIDNREIKSHEERDFMLNNLSELGIRCEQRLLELGDFMWVATAPGATDELVLDWLVERKREDDLVQSISTGRYAEQKVCAMK